MDMNERSAYEYTRTDLCDERSLIDALTQEMYDTDDEARRMSLQSVLYAATHGWEDQ